MSSPRNRLSVGRSLLSQPLTTSSLPLVGEEPVFDQYDDEILDEWLSENGLEPHDQIVIQEGGADAIKVGTLNGDLVYLVLDDQTPHHSKKAKTHQLDQVKKDLPITDQEKTEAFHLAGYAVDGVALECKEGLCMIMHDHQLRNPTVHQYKYKHQKESLEVVASFPVIKMSSFRKNPSHCLSNCRVAYQKMRSKILDSCACDFHHVHQKLEKFNQTYIHLLKKNEDLACKLKNSLNKLEHELEVLKCQTCPDKCKMKKILYNIEKREEMALCLLDFCKHVEGVDKYLEQLTCKMEKKLALTEKHLSWVCCALNPDDCGKCKCVWESYH